MLSAKVLQQAERAGAVVSLLELEHGELGRAHSLFVVVMDVPCKRTGKRQHWSRTEGEIGAALELYECALADHVEGE